MTEFRKDESGHVAIFDGGTYVGYLERHTGGEALLEAIEALECRVAFLEGAVRAIVAPAGEPKEKQP